MHTFAKMVGRRPVLFLSCTLFSVSSYQMAHGTESGDRSLHTLSLEELTALPVISVSKSAEPLFGASASIHVITEQEIRSSGARTLPEALRLAPNLHVAQVDARNYAISARGFNNVFANKLQVMIDGRSIYTPLFTGVFWDAQDTLLLDLDRIEVVSGPGGTLWGANAVNGVINVVSRSARQTQGGLASLTQGTAGRHAAGRYGGEIAGGHYRAYGSYHLTNDIKRSTGEASQTGAETAHVGFRADWQEVFTTENLTVQGDLYNGKLEQPDTADVHIRGGNLLMNSKWILSTGSEFSVQAYLDHQLRDMPTRMAQELTTADIELQHNFALGERHRIIWGGGFRYTADRIENRELVAFLPADVNQQWRNVFVQDEIHLSDAVKTTLGVKLEDNPYSGWESMPSAQLAWHINDTNMVWTSASRVVRSPARIDVDYHLPGVPPHFLAGGPDFEAEVADVYQVGHRNLVGDISYSATIYYSDYDNLRTLELQDNNTLQFKNNAFAHTYGLELWGSWQALARLRLHSGLVLQKIDKQTDPGNTDISPGTALGINDPDFYGQLRATFDIKPNLAFTSTLRHSGEIEIMELPSYTELDLHIEWRPRLDLEVALTGKNLLNSTHSEIGLSEERHQMERAIFLRLIWGR